MSRTLILELPDELYGPLAQAAEQVGATPEQVAMEWLSGSIRATAVDPLENFIGSIHGNPSDWADRHDEYLGQSVKDDGTNPVEGS